MLYTVCSVVRAFFCFAFLAISLPIIPGTEGSKNYPLKTKAIGTHKPEEEQLLSWPWDYLDSGLKKGTVVRLLLYRVFLVYVGPIGE